ncbi:MAG: type II secretion system protein GspN [Deltaproteobacteria bacterium]|nr:type II secretion system protein GspN [Deltaproteobacteria bacterium]
MRLLLFGLLFASFVVVTAPLERYVTPYLRGALEPFGVSVEMNTLRLSLPAGIKATDLHVGTDQLSLELDSLYVSVLRSFAARGCDGASMDGKLTSSSVDLRVSDLDPSRCIKFGRLTLEGTFDGALSLSGVSPLRGEFGDEAEAHVELHTNGGTFGGYLPRSADNPAADVPLGEWEFQQVALDAAWREGKLEVREGKAQTDGVAWELLGAWLSRQNSDAREVHIDFRARVEKDSPRARALLGLMPKAGERAGGWRHYRVLGPLASMKLIGLQ